MDYPNPVVTFLPVYGESVLMIRRSITEENYPGLWAFPGGKVHLGETLIDTLVRELAEETGLTATGEIVFLNSYSFGRSVGTAFAVKVPTLDVQIEDNLEHCWITSHEQFAHLLRIPGIDNHFELALRALRAESTWRQIADVNLTPDKYINK